MSATTVVAIAIVAVVGIWMMGMTAIPSAAAASGGLPGTIMQPSSAIACPQNSGSTAAFTLSSPASAASSSPSSCASATASSFSGS